MGQFAQQIEYYLAMYRRGDADNAFQGLLKIGPHIHPELMEVFRVERDAGLRELLVEVIWDYRDKSIIPFLGEALRDSEPRIWRLALDNLVTLASPDGLEVLERSRTHHFANPGDTDEFRRGVAAAIEQTAAKLYKRNFERQIYSDVKKLFPDGVLEPLVLAPRLVAGKIASPDPAVRLVHKPSGLQVTCADFRSQRENYIAAAIRLRIALDQKDT